MVGPAGRRGCSNGGFQRLGDRHIEAAGSDLG